MQRKWIIIAAALAAWPAGLTAQGTPRPPRPPREPRVRAFMMSDRHGRIGVVVRSDASPETDKVGAKIEGVTPGGPADKAGLKVGDIITKFNGTALGGLKAEDDEESGPGRKLSALARRLEPGDTVRLEYRRGNDTKQTTLVAEDLGGGLRMDMPGPGPMLMPGMPGMDFELSFGAPWGKLELVSLNPDLGEYFGTKEGVLVVKAPTDSSLSLKGGDVILSIGGRKPSSPSHAMRILRSYEKGEAVSIDILRKQKRMTVSWKVPSRETRMFRRREERGEHEEQSGWRGVRGWRARGWRPPRAQRV
jgi:S1-C subfamily serine protease